MLKTCFKREESKHFIYRDYKNFNDVKFRMDQENKLEGCPKHYENFEKTFVNYQMLIRQGKPRFYAVIINPMLIRIFVKPLRNALNLKTRQIELNFKMILLNIRNNTIWQLSFNGDSKHRYFDNVETSENSKLEFSNSKIQFGMSVTPTFPTSMLIETLR